MHVEFDQNEKMVRRFMESSFEHEQVAMESIDPEFKRMVSGWHEDFAENHAEKARFVGRRFRNWGDLLDACRSAWGEGIDTIQQMVDEIKNETMPKPKSRKRRGAWSSEEGDEFDLDRLQRGTPYWRTTQRESASGAQEVTILVQVGGNCGTSSLDLLWQGAAAIAVAEILEEVGFQVQLLGASRTERSWIAKVKGKQQIVGHVDVIELKKSGDVIDRSSLANAVSGWHYRTIHFADAARKRPAPGVVVTEVRTGLGHSESLTSGDIEFATMAKPFVIQDCYSRREATDKAKRILNNIAQAD